MTEAARTIVFVAVAGVLLGLAWAAGPKAIKTTAEEDHTGPFFPKWTDPLAPTSLEIVDYDEDTGTSHPFKVTQVDGKWTIPSHFDYPTDAERQLGEAAASVFELKKLSLVSEKPEEHGLYGVIDPDTAKGGEKGVGKRVTLEDDKGKKLAQFIIGKEDKGQSGIRFVRVPGQDAVYRTELRTDKLSTKFGDWIEKDLLKMNTWDMKEVLVHNYSFDEVNGQVIERDRFALSYDGNASKWSLKDIMEGEELDNDKLNKMKSALDDLKIVDVRRKPEGFNRVLRGEEGARIDQQAAQDLAEKGFYLTQRGLISNEGEVVVKLSDGVLYVLRFGEIAADAGGPADKKEPAEGEDKAADAGSGANRYIFIMAQFDEKIIPQPELKPVPGETLPETPAIKPPDDAAKTEDKASTEDKKADDKKADDKKADAKAEPTEEEKSKQDKERERKEVEKENKRKQDEYDDKVKKGKDRVKQLNDRFADWYYVISDAEYKKIHLSRADLIKAKEAKPDEKTEDKTGVEAFQKLKQEGLKEDDGK